MEQDYKTEMRTMTEGLAEWCHRQKRRQRATRIAIGVTAVVSVFVITSLPDPDGLYVSSLRFRTEALLCADQTFFVSQ